ncbi:hypothetical protein V6N12_020055 [Hibiscus sabdariffa]|uniref:Uncharacterized protein n=1 Tax=Hibiscus sabdariffa TaxID=183260 RepID=A0ABR2B6X8_9ROSI
MVAICALQNFVMRSRTNRRVVAEAGGILVMQELLLSPNAEVASQAALLIKFLFSNHTLQEYVSNELIRSLTAALERELWSTTTINEEVLRTLNVILANFPKLQISEAATLCIPHLVGALKSGSEGAQESVLDTMCLIKHSWSTMPIEIARSQSMIAAEAIPILQMLMKTCPPSFHERADSLLHCLPGCLTVTIKRGSNLKQAMGATDAFCRLTIGNGPPRQTRASTYQNCARHNYRHLCRPIYHAVQGFLDLKMKKWLRNLMTRCIVTTPSLIVSIIGGSQGAGQLIIIASMILSFELPFALIPLLKFSSSSTKLGPYKNSMIIIVVSWILGIGIIGINIYYLSTSFVGWLIHNDLPKVGNVFIGIVVFPLLVICQEQSLNSVLKI